MSTIDLVVLGILSQQPMNAYELTRFVENHSLNRLLKISHPGIYKSCRRLFKAGKLDGKTVRQGEQPEKTVFSVNKNGMKHFHESMRHFSREIKPFYFEFNTFLWNIDKLEANEALAMLKTLEKNILLLKGWIKEHEKEVQSHASFPVKMIVKQYRMVIATFAKWIKEVIEAYESSFTRKSLNDERRS